jgi:hypothetical protein
MDKCLNGIDKCLDILDIGLNKQEVLLPKISKRA